MRSSALVVLILVCACSSGSSQSEAAAWQEFCKLHVTGELHQYAPEVHAQQAARAFEKHISNAKLRDVFAALGNMAPEQRQAHLRKVMAASGISSCAFVDYLERRDAERASVAVEPPVPNPDPPGDEPDPEVKFPPSAPPDTAPATDKVPVAWVTLDLPTADHASSLTPDAVMRKVKRTYTHGLRRCYRKALAADASQKGEVSLRFVVGVRGTSHEVELGETAVKGGGFAECLISMASRWRFPVPKGASGEPAPVTFELGMLFHPRKADPARDHVVEPR